jgi:DNA-binding response OmpR family regulator
MPNRRSIRARRFHDLAPHRVREILLVSSPYDAFILEEEGQLTEQVFFEYREVSLSAPPRVRHVATGEGAIRALKAQRFDLILVMTSLADMGVNALGRRIKKLRPGRPVVLLALDIRELEEARSSIDPEVIDGVFLWSGDAQILLAITKYIEDRANVDHDIAQTGVRVIVMVEDSPRFYSSYLGLLYKELMTQSGSLYLDGVNELQRRQNIRSRPKILHATTYEQAVELLDRYRNNLMALISDIRFPRGGELDRTAGFDLVRHAREIDRELPVLLQSAEESSAEKALEMGASFVDKRSSSLLASIRAFLRDELGFGDFVFRLPDGTEVGRARDVIDFERKLAIVPEEAIAFHAAHNHFSLWLMARSEFELAERLRPKGLSDFDSIEQLREHLLAELRESGRKARRRTVSDFSRKRFEQAPLSRLGGGSLGGKGRGIAFLNSILADLEPADFGGLPVSVPKTVIICTEYFDRFLDDNDLREYAFSATDDRELAARFMSARTPGRLRGNLEFVAQSIDGPLAVRSSSMLEDSLHQPFAGIYSTLMVANRSPDSVERVRELTTALKLVYASTFFRNARAYLETSGARPEEEKMAVVIQQLVGRAHGSRFYPSLSGVGQSYNFYPIGPQRAADGIVHLVLGLGRMVVEGGTALRFSPRHPEVLPQIATPRNLMDATQREFFALDLERVCGPSEEDFNSTVRKYDLGAAERDGSLAAAGSVFSRDDQRIRDDLSLPGPRVVTFNNILKHRAIPLSEALMRLMKIARRGLGYPVEIEFACEMGDWGQPVRRGETRVGPQLFALQVRPFGARTTTPESSRTRFTREDTFCYSDSSLGQGLVRGVRDLVFVRRETWDPARNRRIAAEVGELNKRLRSEDRPYMLIGPGRWGSADDWLGIPVQWQQINGVKVIVEISPKAKPVDPSQGTHFFQNITSLGIGYITLPPGANKIYPERAQFLDFEWMESQTPFSETEHLVHLRLDEPLTVVLDGRRQQAVVALPGATPRDD